MIAQEHGAGVRADGLRRRRGQLAVTPGHDVRSAADLAADHLGHVVGQYRDGPARTGQTDAHGEWL